MNSITSHSKVATSRLCPRTADKTECKTTTPSGAQMIGHNCRPMLTSVIDFERRPKCLLKRHVVLFQVGYRLLGVPFKLLAHSDRRT
jgi:hypothetical protein